MSCLSLSQTAAIFIFLLRNSFRREGRVRGVGVGGSRLQPPERRGRVLCVSPTPLLLGLKVVFFTDFIYLIYIPI